MRSPSLSRSRIVTREAFAGTRPRDFWIYELDPHPNWRAHEIFAKVIGDFLRTSELLPR